MNLEQRRITPVKIGDLGVVAAPDILTGTPAENKALFDRLVRELVADAVNDTLDVVGAMQVCEPYNAEKQYAAYNKVTYDGSTYLCLNPCKSVSPPDARCWLLVSARGTDGGGAGDMRMGMYDPNGCQSDVFGYAIPRLFEPVPGELLCAEADGSARTCGKTLDELALQKDIYTRFSKTPGEGLSRGDTVYFQGDRISKAPFARLAPGISLSSASRINVDILEGSKFRVLIGQSDSPPYTFVSAAAGDDAVTVESPVTLDARYAVFPLDQTRFIVTYSESGKSWTAIGTRNGNALTLGQPAEFEAVSVSCIQALALSETVYAIAYRLEGANRVRLCSVNTNGAVSAGGSAGAGDQGTEFFLQKLSGTSFILAATGHSNRYSVLCVVNGTSIAAYQNLSVPGYINAAMSMTPESYVLLEANRACVVTVAGTSQQQGSYAQLTTKTVSHAAMAKLDSASFAIAYVESTSSGVIRMRVGTILNKAVTFGPETQMEFPCQKLHLSALSDARVLLTFFGQDSPAEWRTLALSVTDGCIMAPVYGGIVSGVGDETADVVVDGVLDGFEGLLPGKTYYRDLNGELTMNATQFKVGRALNSSTMKIEMEVVL